MEGQSSLKKQLRLLEELLLKPEIRGSVKEIDALLADDFIEYGSSGRIYNKKIELEEMPKAPNVQATITDFEVKLLGDGVALATYRAVKHGNEGEELKYSLRSSIWRLHKGKWQVVFHQGTPSIAP